MKYNTYTLDNGLRIIHLPSDSKVVYCGYQINAGTRDEEPGEEGLAHFCEHVTFKGTERRKAWHILNCLESVGGDLNAYTNKEGTVYYSAILKEHIARAVDLLSDIVFHSVYPQAEIDKEVEVICDEIESYNDSPAELIYDEFENILFKGSPLGHNILGTAEQVRSFTTEDALRFTRKLYRPDNAIFFAYGDIDFKKLVKLVRRALADDDSGKLAEEDCHADFADDADFFFSWDFFSSDDTEFIRRIPAAAITYGFSRMRPVRSLQIPPEVGKSPTDFTDLHRFFHRSF